MFHLNIYQRKYNNMQLFIIIKDRAGILVKLFIDNIDIRLYNHK